MREDMGHTGLVAHAARSLAVKRLLLAGLVAGLLTGPAPTALASPPATAIASPDGRWHAYISPRDEIWISTADGRQPRRLLAAKPDDDPRRNLAGFNNLAFSPDGRALYVLTEAWATSNALHRVELDSGKTRFICDANAVEVVTQGPSAGHLRVQKHKYFPQGGSYEAWFLISPAGKEISRIGGRAPSQRAGKPAP